MYKRNLDRLQEAVDMAPQHGNICWALAQVEEDQAYQLCIATSCKDYLTDAIVWCEEGQPAHYPTNFQFYGEYDKENTTLLVRSPNHCNINNHLLNKWEESLGLKQTEWLATDDSSWLLLRADKYWQTTTLHLSLFLSALRQINTDIILNTLDSKDGADYYFREDGAGWGARCMKLALTLKGLVVDRKRNAPEFDSYMHSCNGHYCQLSNANLRNQLYYTKQLLKLDPTIFIGGRNA